MIGELTKDLLINKKFNLNDINFLFDQVTIVNHTPIIGINGPNNNFNGWKRSIVSALKLGRNYNYIIHNEYDLRIQNIYRFTPYINQSGFYCAFCYNYLFIESACMILNNKKINEQIIIEFEKHLMNNSNEIVERFIESNFEPTKILLGIRL